MTYAAQFFGGSTVYLKIELAVFSSVFFLCQEIDGPRKGDNRFKYIHVIELR